MYRDYLYTECAYWYFCEIYVITIHYTLFWSVCIDLCLIYIVFNVATYTAIRTFKYLQSVQYTRTSAVQDVNKEMYEFEEGMSEISGFGGHYEENRRRMVKAGLEWFDEHPKADPKFIGYEGIYGIISEDNEDAKKLSKAVTASVSGCSGAMHQATIGHILHIHKVGWDIYVKEMQKDD